MGLIKNAQSFLGFLVFTLFSHPAMACVGCGQTKLFSPKILAISMSFILLPVTIVTLVGLKLRKDAKVDARLNSTTGTDASTPSDGN